MDLNGWVLGLIRVYEIVMEFLFFLIVVSLFFVNNCFGNEGGRVIVEGLFGNFFVKELDLFGNMFGWNVVFSIGEMFRKNWILEKLNFLRNDLID